MGHGPACVGTSGAKLISPRGAIVCLLVTLGLAWPMLILGRPLMFPDATVYVTQGRQLVHGAIQTVLGISFPDNPNKAVWQTETLRSAPYAVYLYLASRWPLTLVFPTLLQGALVLLIFAALVEREHEAPKRWLALALFACATLTSLPWFVSYAMPDILAAGVILYAGILVRSFANLTTWQRLFLVGTATLATVSHYGHIPLAVACSGAAVGILLLQRRLTIITALAAAAPILLAVLSNVVLGMLAYSGPSAAPKRLPIMLARSMEDGPARWYLEEHCATERYAICEVFPVLPDNVWDVLWGTSSLRTIATPEQIARIRDEEPEILRRTVEAYPWHQARSFVENVGRQLTKLGTGDFSWSSIAYNSNGAMRIAYDLDRFRPALDYVGRIHVFAFVVGLLALLLMALSDGLRAGPRERELLLVVAIGLVANAAIFGGLSAPTDRYQSRVAWIIPACAALFALERLRQRGIRAAQ